MNCNKEMLRLRNTKQKSAIMNVLNSGKHMSPEEVYDDVKKSINIDLSTVYRNLNVLFENGELEKIVSPDGVAIYCRKIKHHGHLICLKCHKVYEIPCNVCDILHNVSKSFDFDDVEHSVIIYGYCKDCKKGEIDK